MTDLARTQSNVNNMIEWGDPIIPSASPESVTYQNTSLGNSLSAFGGINSVRQEIISVFDFEGDFNLLSTDSGPAVRSPKNNGVIDKLDLYVFGRKLMSSKLSSLLASISSANPDLALIVQGLYDNTKQQIDEAKTIIDKLSLIIGLFNDARARIGSLNPGPGCIANPMLANAVENIAINALNDYGQPIVDRLSNLDGTIILDSFGLMGFRIENVPNFSATKIYLQNLKDLQFLLYRPQSPTARINWSAHDTARQTDNDPFEIMGTYSSDETDLEGLFLSALRHTTLDKPPAIGGLTRFTQHLEGMGVLDISRLCLSVLGSEIRWSLILGGKYAQLATTSLEAFGMTNLSQSSIFATKGIPNLSAIGRIQAGDPAYNKQRGDPNTATSPMTKSLATLARVRISDEPEDRVGLSFESLYISSIDSTQCPGGTFIPGTDLFLAGARSSDETALSGFGEFINILTTSVDHFNNIIKAFVNIDGLRPGFEPLDENKLAIQIDTDVWNILYPGFGTTVLLPNGNWLGPNEDPSQSSNSTFEEQDNLAAGNYPYTGHSVTTFTGQRAFWIARNTSAFCEYARTDAPTKRVIFIALCAYVYARSDSARIRAMIGKDFGQSLGASTVATWAELLVNIRLTQGREAMFEASLTYIAPAIARARTNSIITAEAVEQAWGSTAIEGLTYAVPPEVSVLYDHLGTTSNTMFALIHDLFERIMAGPGGLADNAGNSRDWNGLLLDGTNRTRARFISPTTILYLLYEIYVQKIAYFSHYNTDFIRCDSFVSQLDWNEFSDLESPLLDEEIPPADSTPGPVADQEEYQALADSILAVDQTIASRVANETEDLASNLGEAFDALAESFINEQSRDYEIQTGMGVLTQPYDENLLDEGQTGLASTGAELGVGAGFTNVGQEGLDRQGIGEFSMETNTGWVDTGFSVLI